MNPVFYQSPAEYHHESVRISPSWRVWAPIVAPIILGVIAYIDPDRYFRYLQDETGLLEFLHMLLPLISALIAARLLLMPWMRRDPLIVVWLAAIVVGGIYLAGEEASWGQHYFGWHTPADWAELNRQGETNLHNTSFLFDKLPRLVIVAGILVGAIVLPLVKVYRPNVIPRRLDFVIPPVALRVLALVMLVGEIIGEVREKTDALEGILKFNPQGEMQENFIAAFIFFYVVFLWRRAWRARSAMPTTGRAADRRSETAEGYFAAGE